IMPCHVDDSADVLLTNLAASGNDRAATTGIHAVHLWASNIDTDAGQALPKTLLNRITRLLDCATRVANIHDNSSLHARRLRVGTGDIAKGADLGTFRHQYLDEG